MSLLVVTGYASLDYPVLLDGPLRAEGTTLVEHRDAVAWPRPGGSSYIAGAALRAGAVAAPVMWIGQGSEGQVLVRALAGQGAGVTGLAVVDAPRSPTALLVHQLGGGCACLFDPAFKGRERLTEAQRELIAQASHLCVSVGHSQVQGDILALCPPAARLYWAVKDDPDAFPPALRVALAARADVVFCNAAERALVGDTAAVIVETRGRAGVAVRLPTGVMIDVPVRPVLVRDATGAGDTLAGGFIAAEMAGASPLDAARAGVRAAADLLTEREGRSS